MQLIGTPCSRPCDRIFNNVQLICSLLRLSSGNDAGCAKASSAITAASFSQATYTGVFKSLELPIKEYCAGSDTPLYVYAQQVTMSTRCSSVTHSAQTARCGMGSTQTEHPAAAASIVSTQPCEHTACEPQAEASTLPHQLYVVLQIANAHAKSIAQTLTFYSQYVCTCCRGNSGAYSAVAADVKVSTGTPTACQVATEASRAACLFMLD